MKRVVFLLSIFLLIFLSQNILASISVSTSSINPQYTPNSTISGWFNANISNEPANSYFSTDSNQNISLVDFMNALEFIPNTNYTCFPADCNPNYVINDTGSTKEKFHLNAGQSKIFGIDISGGFISDVSDFSLNVSSNAQESNVPQLSIDLLNDNLTEWSQYKSSGTLTNNLYYGCYLPNSNPNGSYKITSTSYCGKIYLPNSPIINLGADITGSGVSNLILSIYDSNFIQFGTCSLPPQSGHISCIASNNNNYVSIINGSYYVCINIPNPDPQNDKYYISSQSQSPFCGFYGNEIPSSFSTNYALFAQPGNFASIGSFILNTTEAGNSGFNSGGSLESEIYDYISSKYNNNCTNGCVVPIKFTATTDQDINLSNFSLQTTILNTGVKILNNLYKIIPSIPVYNTMGSQKFSLDVANFAVPNAFGPHNFVLSFNNNSGSYQILSKSINILQTSQVASINPTVTTATLPTTFSINTNTFGSNVNIVQYQWNFGDGSGIQTTDTNNITYTYSQLGQFNLGVNITNSLNLSSVANFTINVISPKSAVNQLLTQDINNLQTIQNQMKNLSDFSRNILNQTLGLGNISTQLNDLKIANSSASSDDQYLDIMNDLIYINLPSSISQTQKASLPFFQGQDNIDLNALQTIGGGSYDSTNEGDYVNAIIAYDLNNVTTTINYAEFSAAYGPTISPILDTIELDVNGPSGYYLVIPSSFSNLQFDNTYSSSGDYYYVPLTGSPQTIKFATTDSISPEQLPIFIAPSLTQLPISSQMNLSQGINKYLVLGLVIFGVIVLIILVIIVISRWYRKRYESYLFKDRNDLYNIINYINSAKSKGIKNKDIEKNLRKSRWTSEQVNYVMKRYAHRRQKPLKNQK